MRWRARSPWVLSSLGDSLVCCPSTDWVKEIRTPAEDRIHGRNPGLPPIRQGATRQEGGWMHAAREFLCWRMRTGIAGLALASCAARGTAPSLRPLRKRPLHAGLAAAKNAAKRKPAYLPAFFSFLAARFSLSDFSGFFFSVFFWSMPLLISRSALVVAGKAG